MTLPTIKQNLGRVRIDNKGAWVPGTYDNLDVVTLGGSSYMCIKDGTTENPETLDGWEVLAEKGETGAKGDRGERGEKGDQGDIGPQGVRGPRGETGPEGPQGKQGPQGIQGPQGDPGEVGPEGPQGEKGDPGHTPQRGVDYWTVEDRKPVEDATAAANAAAEKAENATEVTTYSRIPISFEGSEPGICINQEGYRIRLDADKYPEFKVSRPVGISGITGNIIIDTGSETEFNKYSSVCAFFATEDIMNAAPVSFVPYTRGGVYSVEVPSNAKYVVFNNNVSSTGVKIADISARVGRSNVESFAEVAGLVEAGGNLDVLNCINLPERYRLVVGDKFELFWKGVIQAIDPYSYNIRARCDVGSCYRRKYEFTPTSAGEHTLTVSVENGAGNVLDSASVILEVNARASSPSSNVNVLCVGDSLTVSGQWPYESNRRLTGNGGTPAGDGLSNVTYIGTCEKDGVKFESYGGWTFDSYNRESKSDSCAWITCSHSKTGDDQHSMYSDANGAVWKIETIEASRLKTIRVSGSTPMPESGTLTYVSGGVDHSDITFTSSEAAAGNPFWNEATGSVDFAEYARKVGASSIDYCYVLLGWNAADLEDHQLKSSASTFIGNLLSSFPNCKIALMGLEVPSPDGLGVNYGCSWNYVDKLRTVFRFNRVYESLADEYENVHFVNIAGQFDTENNMQESTRQVNARNATTETYQTNGIHPATSGYNQIADAVYRDLTGMLVQ